MVIYNGDPSVLPEPVGLTIPGKPFAWKRARVETHGHRDGRRRAKHFEDTDQARWKHMVCSLVLKHTDPQTRARWCDGDLLGSPLFPLRVEIVARFPMGLRPRVRVPRPERHKMTRPDIDNLAKAVLDALNGVLWRDDSQVVELQVRKCFAAQGDEPQTYVRIEELAS